MRRLTTFLLVAFLFMQTLPLTVSAQGELNVFTLPTAQATALYQVNIEQLLRDNYKLKLASDSHTQNFRWYLQSGVLPFGLRLNPDGNIVGRPRAARAESYLFKLKVSEPGVGPDALTLSFQLNVEAPRIRLVSTSPPRLLPVEEESRADDRNGKAAFSHANLLSSSPDPMVSKVNPDALTFGARRNTGSFFTSRRGLHFPARALGPDARSSGSTDLTSAAGRPSPVGTALAVAPRTFPVDDPCPDCLPSVRPDEKTDFIINARTGETSGKKKFGLRDNARIIVIEKNPFLYEYRVTLKDKPIVESAIAEFFGGWPLFVDSVKPKDDSKATAEAAAPPCPELDEALKELSGMEQYLADADSSADDNSLRNRYLAEKTTYEGVSQQADSAKKTLYDENTSCSNVCATATGIRSTLGQYNPDLERLSDDVNRFKSHADTFQRDVLDLENRVRHSKPALPGECLQVVDALRNVAAGYMTTAEDLESGIKKMTTGKKAFETIVKTINNVFASPNSFYQVYRRGEYSAPTDVEITVEKKDLTKDDATFAKVVDAEMLNFGGGARFAIAGGVVVSPFETINFKRVPALIGGQPVTIVGKDEGSNSRILPILMLHGRLFNGKGSVSGVHLSLGVTAKPDDKGTNVEFLVGPSISFIEEHLFLTFGGYAGRRKQLEGNLVLGQQLPKEFTEDIPTSDHLVWKPGFALTYKFK